MVFGSVNGERIQLNENSLWMGGPRDTNNPDALEHLAEVRRLLFAIHPAQAIVMRLSADTPGTITVSAWIDRQQDATTEVAGNDRLNLIGGLAGGKGLAFLASVKILADGGRLDAYPERIYAQGANTVTLIVAAATSYRGNDHRAAVERSLAAAIKTPYEKLKADHVADHQQFFRKRR